jgi:hypothetical protein
MQKKTYSKEEFQAMVAELESEFMNLLKSEQESAQLLAKSEEKEEEAKKEEKEEAKEEPKAEAKESDEKKDEPKAEDKKDEEKKDEEESHDYDEEDMEEMQKMYSSMSKGELKAHKDVIEKCYMAKCGEMTQMGKSEEASQKAESKSSSSEQSLLKSELEAIKKENEDLKKNIEGLVAAINTFVTKKQAPARKAITNIEFVKKSEEGSQEKPLTKSEINMILAKKARDPKTSPQDRAAINEFYLTNGSVEKIAHLLKQ